MRGDEDVLRWLTVACAFGFSTGIRPGQACPLLDGDVGADEWLGSDEVELAAHGVAPAQRRRLLDPATRDAAARLIEETARVGLGLVARGGDGWPAALAGLPAAPPVLWHRGILVHERAPALAVVGTRCPTPYGMHAARCFAEALGLAGIEVVSGLARGIDAAAHAGVLRGGAPTIAILGSGLDRIYPVEHESLVERIIDAGGAVLSEYPPGYRAHPGTFPRRNRIIAALATGVLVVEAGRRSGALITCDWALAYDRPIWAVPGPFSSPASSGCHRLIRDGAFLAESPDGLLEELGVASGRVADVGCAREARVLEVLRRGPQLLDALVTEVRAPPAEVLLALDRLELRGIVEYRAGWYSAGLADTGQPRRATR